MVHMLTSQKVKNVCNLWNSHVSCQFDILFLLLANVNLNSTHAQSIQPNPSPTQSNLVFQSDPSQSIPVNMDHRNHRTGISVAPFYLVPFLPYDSVRSYTLLPECRFVSVRSLFLVLSSWSLSVERRFTLCRVVFVISTFTERAVHRAERRLSTGWRKPTYSKMPEELRMNWQPCQRMILHDVEGSWIMRFVSWRSVPWACEGIFVIPLVQIVKLYEKAGTRLNDCCEICKFYYEEGLDRTDYSSAAFYTSLTLRLLSAIAENQPVGNHFRSAVHEFANMCRNYIVVSAM